MRARAPDGRVARAYTRTLTVLRTERIDLGSVEGVRTSAQVSTDGDLLFVGSAEDGSAVYAIDTKTLEPTARWPMSGRVSGLGLSGDGLRLFVAMADHVAVLDASTGEELTAVPFAGATSILEVPAPAG